MYELNRSMLTKESKEMIAMIVTQVEIISLMKAGQLELPEHIVV